ncbi:MAG: pyruvate kinase [Flavobacteriaceae bacterium]|nr:pyruvate kinase [Flavobacteriaceae bacterium]
MNSKEIFDELNEISRQIVELENEHHKLLESPETKNKVSITNLLNYIALRRIDIRAFQDTLHAHGLSSFAGSESHVASQLVQVKKRLMPGYTPGKEPVCDFIEGRKRLESNAQTLFGNRANQKIPYLMVTCDAAFLDQPEKMRNLLENGMNIIRINCAHDNPKIWKKLIELAKTQAQEAQTSCKIYMDLAGPKIRTEFFDDTKSVVIQEDEVFYIAESAHAIQSEHVVLGCTLPGITHSVQVGERVMIDDGAQKSIVVEKNDNYLKLLMLRNSKKSKKIKAEKGLNFPDSILEVPSLTDYDLECLDFISEHADIVGYSFVNSAHDIRVLQNALKKYDKKPYIILKIETPASVANLPSLLIEGMRKELIGVMIARGDLAVEIGFARMSEVQDEILWFCEAAHVPVIWATQVLENLHKTGIATRAEMTDAAHAVAAECVMINKGDFTEKVLQTLKDVLQRTRDHRFKKRYYLRPLNIAHNFTIEKE